MAVKSGVAVPERLLVLDPHAVSEEASQQRRPTLVRRPRRKPLASGDRAKAGMSEIDGRARGAKSGHLRPIVLPPVRASVGTDTVPHCRAGGGLDMRCPHEPAMSRDSSMSFITFLSDASAAKPTAVASVANLGYGSRSRLTTGHKDRRLTIRQPCQIDEFGGVGRF